MYFVCFVCESVRVWMGGGLGEELEWVVLGGGRRMNVCVMGICAESRDV